MQCLSFHLTFFTNYSKFTLGPFWPMQDFLLIFSFFTMRSSSLLCRPQHYLSVGTQAVLTCINNAEGGRGQRSLQIIETHFYFLKTSTLICKVIQNTFVSGISVKHFFKNRRHWGQWDSLGIKVQPCLIPGNANADGSLSTSKNNSWAPLSVPHKTTNNKIMAAV